MFRQKAKDLPSEASALNAAILELAQLLADSRGRLSKENFDVLVRIGGTLYKNGHDQFDGKSDVDAIMRHSHRNQDEGSGSH
jgi:hypothetical protein